MCVNTALDRLECHLQKTEEGCKSAPGLPDPNEMWDPGQQHRPLSAWWAQVLYDGGCEWSKDSGSCSAFRCESLASKQACHLAAHPPPPNGTVPPGAQQPEPMPKHCVWDKHKGPSGKCVKITPSQYCEAQLNPQNSDGPGPPRPPFGPVPPPPPPQELCEEGYASMLCMWSPNATERKGGRCVPTHCEAITNKTLCNAKSGALNTLSFASNKLLSC